MAPGAHAFITAAVNAAYADHIYLYRNASEALPTVSKETFESL